MPQSQSPPTPPKSAGVQLEDLRGRMTSVALRIAGARPEAEDIVQSAFEKSLRKLDQFDARARFSTWVHRIVVNEALMWLRAERRRSRHLRDVEDRQDFEKRQPESPDPVLQLSAQERASWLREAILRLPDEERDVLIRCGLEEVSYDEFHRETGVEVAAAKSRAFRGRRRLRERLSLSSM